MKSSILLELLPQIPLCWYGSNRGGDIPNDPGAYVLEIYLKKAVQFSVSRLGNQLLPPGRYFYVGSARGPGGLGGRLKRHFMPDKTLHWHVDYLGRAVAARRHAGLDSPHELLSHISPLGGAHILLTGDYRWPKS